MEKTGGEAVKEKSLFQKEIGDLSSKMAKLEGELESTKEQAK